VDYRIIMLTRIIIADRIALGRRVEKSEEVTIDDTFEEVGEDVVCAITYQFLLGFEKKACFPAVLMTDTSYTKIAFCCIHI